MHQPKCVDIGLISVPADIQGWTIGVVSEVKINYFDRPNMNIPVSVFIGYMCLFSNPALTLIHQICTISNIASAQMLHTK